VSAFLLALSIGPVQEFIAAARRTRDLWFGSYLLSELSREAAKSVREQGGNLIFPTKEDADRDSAVANIILAELPEGVMVHKVPEKARQAVEMRWLEFATEARKVVERAACGARVLRENLWKSQLEDAIEFYAAWTPIIEGQYGHARTRVMRLLAGRKACRDFIQPKGDEAIRRVPKSSLDGRRDSVLQKDENIPIGIRQKLHLNKGEQLCAVGLTKRLAGGIQPYPSVSRVAADPWLCGVAQAARENQKVKNAFDRLMGLCSEKPIRDCLVELDRVRFPQYRDFPYEGTCLFPNRFEDWRDETGLTIEDQEPLLKILEEFKGLGLGQPDPYLAILVADGDHIGQLLSQLKQSEEHRDFSHALAGFSQRAKDIIVRHQGICVFAGGDDVLAFVPVDRCLPCAQELHEGFAGQLKAALPKNVKVPTLSVGIAIGHSLEPLEDLHAYGKQAEKMAKAATLDCQGNAFGERNGLAVMVHPRSGVPFGVREQWQDNENSLDVRLKEWAERFLKREIPRKLPYDLRSLGRELEAWPSPGAPPSAVAAELRVLLKRKHVEKGIRQQLEERFKPYRSAQDVLRLAREMLVAQWIADAESPSDTSNSVEAKEGQV
jgi:CRISPR-associated protein Cmr2